MRDQDRVVGFDSRAVLRVMQNLRHQFPADAKALDDYHAWLTKGIVRLSQQDGAQGGEAVAYCLRRPDGSLTDPWIAGQGYPRPLCEPNVVDLYTRPAIAPQATPAADTLRFTDATIDKMQAVMAVHGFIVPVRVISDAFRTTIFALAAPPAEVKP